MIAIFLVGVVAVALVAYVALRNARNFSDANEIVPGVDTGAPKSWAGSHTAEARLHRRLRDACEALRVNAALDDPSLQPVRADLEEQAVAIDRRLVAVAALPMAHRSQPLDQVTRAVEAIEGAVAAVVALRGPADLDVTRAINEVQLRAELVAQARDELEALTAPTPDLDALRRELGDEVDQPTQQPTPPPSPPAAGPEVPGEPGNPGRPQPEPGS